jgi:poly(3-hydroxybutyrate) depolymerase
MGCGTVAATGPDFYRYPMNGLYRFGVAAIATLLIVLGLGAPAQAASPYTVTPVDGSLRAYNISGVYVSGVSSGGYMATQLQVAYSSRVRGAAIFAAGPYYCAQNNAAQAVYGCGMNVWPDYLSTLEADTSLWSGYGWIDPIRNLSGQPVYVYHGTNDSTVAGSLTNDLVSFYRHFGATAQYVTSSAGHAWVTPYGPSSCDATASPYLNNCGTDPQNGMLSKLFGTVAAPNTGPLTGTLTRFGQDTFAVNGFAAGLSMGSFGFAYVPAPCAAGASCRLMVALHGCAQGYDAVGTAFVDDANLDQYADTNAMIVLYPQATASGVNPYGCWDWWGYLGTTNYPIHGGAQIETIMNEISALGG